MPIGSLGSSQDTKIMLGMSCFDPIEGHGFDWYGESYPGSPRCAKCRTIWKSRMGKRGLTRAQIERLFQRVGAKWSWASDLNPKPKKETPVEKLGIETQQMLGRSYVEARYGLKTKEESEESLAIKAEVENWDHDENGE